MSNEEVLRSLAKELAAAELEHLEKEGQVLTRLHDAIAAICVHAGIIKDSDDEP